MVNPVKNIQRTAAEYRQMDKKDQRRFWVDGILNNALYILMVIFIIYTAFKNENFLKPGSIVNIISLAAASLPIALGIGGCIVLTGTDLSAGRVVGLSAAISAALLQSPDWANKIFTWLPDLPMATYIVIAIIAVMIVGSIVGFINGFFVAKFSLHPFIVTLATQLITYGAILMFFMSNGNNGQPLSGLSDTYKNFVTGSMIKFQNNVSIPWYVLYAVLMVIAMWFIWNKTTFGKNMFALGANEEAARVSGVNVFMTTIMVFALAGAMYGWAGFVESARVASNTANTGVNYELDAIAACVIGGVSFVGGIGKVSGIIIGVIMLRLIFVALPLVGMDQNLQYAIKGGIILFACALDMRKYLVKK